MCKELRHSGAQLPHFMVLATEEEATGPVPGGLFHQQLAELFGEMRARLLEEADPDCLLGPRDGKGVAECPPIPSRLLCQTYQLELQVTVISTLNPSLLTDPKL